MSYKPMMIKGPVFITIAANVRNPNIQALINAAGWMGFEAIILTINTGVYVSNLNIPALPAGVLTIINRGTIGAEIYTPYGLYTRSYINIDNAGGTIFGVGGFGGMGGSMRIQNPDSTSYTATSTGGAGGRGGGFGVGTGDSLTLVNGATGDSGNTVALAGPSTGGLGSTTGGRGGTGGSIGQAGNAGSDGSATGRYNLLQTFPPNNGDPAGNYINGIAYVNWLAFGSRLGNAI